ncbi:MmyB family transcriptional regulator [Streptantibioticus cattleyicolor]|uniref:MmyB-like transcription regulator ligand binding domain-containing protein n=1 Tax=Streptantibioticus cattleyicolor (strain ATCC 35852 / DSM 46488 / JCM 4925 / NBRC 14057 / NRRL 8057) TaxID=1003195 RepID=F8JNL1_STREN|nr:hypothetical protein [Streptantibioticus cattleyicolor]AEW99022.1 hypothetical protein SCATT_p08290 [Streptantibioticus cattleyicolor NRRL 8057 = DSM 46488]CCB71931.1 protein of unknown function [Streptantibioticus cattleyicolor NRRL 8057 = DSM 46488]
MDDDVEGRPPQGWGAFITAVRHRMKLPQRRFAALVRASEHTVINWERGSTVPNRKRIDELRRRLDLGPQEEALLYWLADHSGPPVPASSSLHDLAPHLAGCKLWIDRQSDPTCLTDVERNVVLYNEAYELLMADMIASAPKPSCSPLHNPLRFVAFHPGAREMLVDWYDRWLLPALAQLSVALLRYPDAAELRRIAVDLEADEITKRAFVDDLPIWPGRPENLLHGDGRPRRIRHPDLGVVGVHVIESVPVPGLARGLRSVTLLLPGA